jgi:acyl carrier protein
MADTAPMREFIIQAILFGEQEEIKDDTELFPGIVDSLGVLDLSEFISVTYGVEIDDSELRLENFRTLATIAALIDRKLA